MKVSAHTGVHHMAGHVKGKKHADKAPSTSTASDNPQSNTSGTISTITSGPQLSFQNKLAASAIDQSTTAGTNDFSTSTTNKETSVAPINVDIGANS